jgi:hypothetical protein
MDFYGALYNHIGFLWTFMVLYGPPMAFYGPPMAFYGPPMALYGPPMDLYSPPMAFFVLFIVSFGPSMVHIDPFGPVILDHSLLWSP